MKTTRQPITRRRGFTLLEMTIVIMVLIALISTGLFVNTKMDEWKLGRAASETLRQVYTAQRMFLADNPTRLVSAITNTVNVSPPVINAGSGVPYDPSGDNRDSLWDVGE